VVPAEARRDFKIQRGGKPWVFGDLDQGVAFAPSGTLRKTMRGAMDFLHDVGPAAPDAALPRQIASRSKKR
jgi:hypothetical protein